MSGIAETAHLPNMTLRAEVLKRLPGQRTPDLHPLGHDGGSDQLVARHLRIDCREFVRPGSVKVDADKIGVLMSVVESVINGFQVKHGLESSHAFSR